MIRTLIVDDEEPARSELRHLLNQTRRVKVVGEAADGRQALCEIFHLKPDAVFLDIKMPEISGLEIARQLIKCNQPKPLIVFATAYDKYAIEAFEINAIDYLLKPFDFSRLLEAVERIQERLEHMESPEKYKSRVESLLDLLEEHVTLKKIPVHSTGRVVLIDAHKIYCAFTHNRKVYLKTNQDVFETDYTLQKLGQRLGVPFFRVHRSFLVNLSQVREIIPWFGGTYELVLSDKQATRVPVSRQRVTQLKSFFGL